MDTQRTSIFAAVLLAVATPALAQTSVTQTSTTTTTTTGQMTGVSNPPQDAVATTQPDAAAQPDNDSNAPIPVTAAPPQPAPRPAPVLLASATPPAPVMPGADPDGDITNGVAIRPGELAEGTLLRVKLSQPLSTEFSKRGDAFAAQISGDVMQNGLVVIPSGAVLRGHVTESVESRVAMGRSKLHLHAEDIVMPDGSRLRPQAVVIDTDQTDTTKIDDEGTIISKKGVRKNLVLTGSMAGIGAGAGALAAGPTGAVVGTLVGAGVGAGHWMRSEQITELPQDAVVIFQLTQSMSIIPR